MIGRVDVRVCRCWVCEGTGKSPQNRTRECKQCAGTGKALYCQSCARPMPCPGTSKTRLDQTYCAFRGIRATRTTAELMAQIRELHAAGGPGDFERIAETVMQLDVLLQQGAPPPEEWESAFRAEHRSREV